jgi:hypothetical protein
MPHCGKAERLPKPFRLLRAILFVHGFATEMSVVDIFLEGLLVCDTARFRGAIITDEL